MDFFAKSISDSEVHFGGLNPGVERVFFTHGELDPSRDKGPSTDLNPNAPVVVMSSEIILKTVCRNVIKILLFLL